MGEHDVDGEESRVGERESDAYRLAVELHVGQQVDTADGQREREGIPSGARAGGREKDDGEELDRGHRPEGEAVDRDVEADVHPCEDEREPDHGSPGRPVRRRERTPRPPPEREDRGGARDAEPGHAERLDAGEEEDGECRAEVVEDRAADEVRVRGRRHARPREQPARRGDGRDVHLDMVDARVP